MSNEMISNINIADNASPSPVQGNEHPALVKRIGKTIYRVTIHFTATSSDTMREKVKWMLRNEMQQM